MKEYIVARVGFFSDPHFSVESEKEEEKWFPPVCNFLEKINSSGRLVKKFLSFWDKKTQSSFKKIIEKMINLQPFDLVVGLGDYTPGANESGMLTPKTQEQYFAFQKIIDQIDCPKKLVWGGHDVGYRFNVSGKIGIKIGTETGGMSVESAESATKLIGEPFGCFWVDQIKFIYISTNLIRNVNEESPKKLGDLKLSQENFLARTLNNGNKKAFLLLHDPTALSECSVARIIIDSHRDKIIAIIHGHLHAEFVSKITKNFPVYQELYSRYETILVPASWGMMGIGGGFLIMNIYNNGTFKINFHKTN